MSMDGGFDWNRCCSNCPINHYAAKVQYDAIHDGASRIQVFLWRCQKKNEENDDTEQKPEAKCLPTSRRGQKWLTICHNILQSWQSFSKLNNSKTSTIIQRSQETFFTLSSHKKTVIVKFDNFYVVSFDSSVFTKSLSACDCASF